MDSILLVEDNDSLREVLAKVLAGSGYQVGTVGSAEEALGCIKDGSFSMVLCDLKLPGMNGLELLKEAKELDRRLPIVVMTAYGNIDIAVEAMKCGAKDFITKPFDPKTLCDLISQIITHERIVDRTLGDLSRHNRNFITENEKMLELLHHARKVAPLSSAVMILGESGTGKELIARYIHAQSVRPDRPFVAINCASLPHELLESEFFGYEAGAFTGATERRIGLFEVADGGSIFLDEIGDMPLSLQTKLLRCLQEAEIRRVGSTKVHKVDVRVISATHNNLEDDIRKGSFREDLYYRLGVVILEIPPLRERAEDIPLLSRYFVKHISQELGRDTPSLSRAALKRLCKYSWPGNVRELENVIERALVFSDDKQLGAECFDLNDNEGDLQSQWHEPSLSESVQEAVRRTESDIIQRALSATRGNKLKAARLLRVSYKTLLNKVKDYSLL